MAVIGTGELLRQIRERTGESDDDLVFLENVTDTVQSLAAAEDWKRKYEENDAAWRTRYKERFDNVNVIPPSNPTSEPPPEEIKTFEDLFK
jgi:hypothetical protein